MNLRQICQSERYARLTDSEYLLFKKEMGSIEIHNMEPYFLDIISKNIKVTNNCNSMVAYLCGITDEKPVRSINYKGGTSPDIDTDISRVKRQEVLDYIKQKYGESNVAGISTYGIMWAKGAVRLAAKALGYSMETENKVANLVPDLKQGRNWTIDEALAESSELKALYDSDDDAEKIINYAKKIDGIYSNRSQHAAGYIISDRAINDILPTWYNTENFPVVEASMSEVEALSLLKADFLGLSTLDVIDTTLKFIKQRHNVNIDIDNLPDDDSKTLKLLSTGNLMGIFQLEGRDISNYTKLFKPTKFMDIVLISSGYRPGPIQFMHNILKIRHKDSMVDETEIPGNRFPIIKEILKDTYGYFIFQEQLMKVVQLIAGYTDTEADEFRKIISKKIRDKLPKERERFFEKAAQHGMTTKETEDLWDQMIDFANYAFNLSHGVAYSLITYTTAYLKAHYPVEFYAANILSDINNQEKVNLFIADAKAFNIDILPPDINESNAEFSIINDKVIRFGIGGIKYVGMNTAQQFISERTANGKYSSVSHFIARNNPRSNVLNMLIIAGAFNSIADKSVLLDHNDTYNMHNYEALLEYIKYAKEKQWILSYEREVIAFPIAKQISDFDNMLMEQEALGMNIQYNVFNILNNNVSRIVKDHPYAIICKIGTVKPFKSAKGCKASAITDEGHSIDILIFSNLYNKVKKALDNKDKTLFAITNYKYMDDGAIACNKILTISIPNSENSKYIVNLEDFTVNDLGNIKHENGFFVFKNRYCNMYSQNI